jgi:capsular exopolysaccharide synthesis family protein
LPVLAEVPSIPRRRRASIVTVAYPYSRAADAFRLVGVGATRWAANGNGTHRAAGKHRAGGAETILVTSPEAGDGKTTVVANLAAAISQTGKRVLVVSGDLRRPEIHETFGVPIRPGLTDALHASNGGRDPGTPPDLGPYLEPCSIVRVAVMPSGVVPERPAEMLGSPTMATLMERLRRLTDVVIVDSAPMVVASDVAPLVPLVDGIVIVARAGKTKEELAANTATMLERLGAETAGVVLNDTRDFAIPQPKKSVYEPTRKMKREAVRAAAETPWVASGAAAAADEPEAAVAEPEPPTAPEPEPPPAEPGAPTDRRPVSGPTGTAAGPPLPMPEPVRELQVPDVDPAGDERGGGGPSLSAIDPGSKGGSAATLIAPERLVVIPEPSLEPRTETGTDRLDAQLAELRAFLRGSDLDRGGDGWTGQDGHLRTLGDTDAG